AATATFIEKHVPSARIVEENIRTLNVEDRSTLLVTSAFLWAKRDLEAAVAAAEWTRKTWLVFCSPPYAFYRDRQVEMLDLIGRMQKEGPAGTILIVEADDQFDFELLRSEAANRATAGDWDVRAYAPAV